MSEQVFQFKVTLLGSNPSIWRQIQILDACTFWELHTAIQSAMGWQDCHLHDFRVINSHINSNNNIRIGMPIDDDDKPAILASWDTKVYDYLTTNKVIEYVYDYGDHWLHEIKYEGIFPKLASTKYPLCLAGENACPPDGCGGMQLYNALLQTLNDKNHPDHIDSLEFFGDKFAPNKFDIKQVKFKNPNIRLKKVQENIEDWID